MRNPRRDVMIIVGTAAVVAGLFQVAPPTTGQALAFSAARLEGTQYPDLNGIWQAVNTAQLAELPDPTERAREAATAQDSAVTAEIADLRTQVSALHESTEQARTDQDSAVTGEIANLITQLSAQWGSTEQARKAQDSAVTGQIADLRTQLAELREPTEQARGDGSEPEILPEAEKPGPTPSSQPETPSATTKPAFLNSLARRMPRVLTRKARRDTEDLSKSVERSPESEVPVAVERLRRMLDQDTKDEAVKEPGAEVDDDDTAISTVDSPR